MAEEHTALHKLLKQQIEEHLADADPGMLPDGCEQFIAAVNTAFITFEKERGKLASSLEQSFEALFSTNAEMNALLRALPDLILRLDNTGLILECRTGGYCKVSLPDSELVNTRIQECSYLNPDNVCVDAFERVKEIKSTQSYEYLMSVNGEEQLCEARILPLNADQYMVFIRDITGREENQRSLRTSFSQLSQKSRHETIINTITAIIHQTLDLDTVLVNAVNAVRDNIEMVESVVVYMVEGDEAVIRAEAGLTPDYIEAAGRIKYPKGFTWKTISQGVESYCPDVAKDPSIGPAGIQMGIKSYYSMPVSDMGKTVGCLNVHSYTEDAFDVEERYLLGIVIQQIEVALKNARQAEALMRSEEMYRTLFDQSPVGVYIVDMDMKITNCNESMVQIFRSSIDEIIGLDLNSLKDKTFVPSIEEALEGKYGHLESIYQASTSPLKLWLAVRTAPVKDSEGNVIGAMCVVTDITARKVTEEKLRESEEVFRTITEHSTDMIIEVDSFGTLLFASANHFDLLGYTPEEMVGNSVFKNIHPDDINKVMAAFSVAQKADETSRSEFRYRHKNGSWRYLESSGRRVRTAAGALKGIITSRDITEQKKMQEEMLRAQQLDSLSVLAGGIAHDFNNLLTVILGNIFLARQHRLDEDVYEERFAESVNAVKRASDLTQQLLTFAKGGTPVKKPTSISELLIESANFAISGSNVDCLISTPDEVYPVEIDEGQISQVIHNFVINAKQAMAGGGTVYVVAENLDLTDEDTIPLPCGRYVDISIADTGIGIAKEDLPKIFDPYFTTKEDGNGLGLTTSYSIVNQHDGLITVDSEPGKGTTFHIYLPATDKTLVPMHDQEQVSIEGRGKVLIMDDDPTIRSVMGMMLLEVGFDVEHASKGEEAIEKYCASMGDSNPYDLVILDLTIPGGIGGKETLMRLLDIDPEVKAIVSSGYSDAPVLADYASFGFKGCVTKPFGFEDMIKVVKEVLA